MTQVIDRAPQLPSRVAYLLGAAIAEGRWKAGERLPTEQALADAYGVSRNVVREAISRLRADGVVQSRQGVGAFVMRGQPAAPLRFDREMLADPMTLQSLFELRAILEIQSAGLAAERHGPNELAAISSALNRMVSEVDDPTGGVEADLDFHRAVAGAAKNPYIAKVISFLSDQISETILAARVRPGISASDIIRITIEEHTAIRDAVSTKSAESARDAMASHIRNAASRMGFELAVR
jgi:GntR family transcriptional repressor for pyruvate dehydrogenase complex